MIRGRTPRCALKAGHPGPHQWVMVTATPRPRRQPAITPSEPPCIQGLIDRVEADVRAGRLRRHS